MFKMIDYLIIAWILSWFNFDKVVIDGFKELFNLKITLSGYYLIFALAGLVCAFIKMLIKSV